MRFEFATANRILFGEGVRHDVAGHAAAFGRRALVVCGKSVERIEPFLQSLKDAGLECQLFQVAGEPTVELAGKGIATAREFPAELVIGVGGGSVIDTGKIIAAMLANSGELYDYLEVVGKGQPLENPSAPYIAIPTTAGTGAEVTRNSVLGVPEHGRKVSVRSPHMLPTLAVVDPELTYSLPPEVTARTGLDALTQCLEPYVSHKATPLTDGLCREGMVRAARSLRRAVEQGNDAAAREDMAVASLFGGLALANAKLGAVHGFAGPLGGMIPAPHGTICGRLLAPVMEKNIQVLRDRAKEQRTLERYTEVARLLTGDCDARAEDGARWVRELVAAMPLPRLAEYGLAEKRFSEAVEKSGSSSSMKGNPVPFNEEELRGILEAEATL